MNNGWQCPVCGRGVAPTVSVCPCANVSGQTVYTYTPVPSADTLREMVNAANDFNEPKGECVQPPCG